MAPKNARKPDDSFKRVDEALAKLVENLSLHQRPGDVAGLDGEEDEVEGIWQIPPKNHLVFETQMDLSTKEFYPHIKNDKLRSHLNRLHELETWLPEWTHNIGLHLEFARTYVELGYPDLAVGAAYKCLLLIDAANDCADEYHQGVLTDLRDTIMYTPMDVQIGVAWKYPEFIERFRKDDDAEARPIDPPCHRELLVWCNEYYALSVYVVLSQCLYVIGCYKSAMKYVDMGLKLFPDNGLLNGTKGTIYRDVADYFIEKRGKDAKHEKVRLEDWPDQGWVRRECYPWNKHEADRTSDESVAYLNKEMETVAPKLEVRATELPLLSFNSADHTKTTRQLGVFAKEDIGPGEIVLNETSLLTANNRLQDALCDACSADLPEQTMMSSQTIADGPSSTVIDCEECSAVFCSQRCHDLAMSSYHPALCDKDVEALAKDVPPAEAADALYTLLLLRTLAMSETQMLHPLDLHEVKYIWGDYHTASLDDDWRPHDRHCMVEDDFPRTLPWSFTHNVLLPFNMLEKMDIDVFSEGIPGGQGFYDVWVFNTLYAKFRGTASARLSGASGGPARGPEVSAVHPMWCLANHSCDPNVTWEWGGVMNFWTREQRVQWKKGSKGDVQTSQAGLRKGQELLNHYCDVDLPVKERREWAMGALGGICCCERCVWEAEDGGVRLE